MKKKTFREKSFLKALLNSAHLIAIFPVSPYKIDVHFYGEEDFPLQRSIFSVFYFVFIYILFGR